MLGSDGDPVKCVTMEEDVGCECVATLSTNHFSTSFIRSSEALTCPRVLLEALGYLGSVPGTSSVPWDVNRAYKGEASRDGEEDKVSVVCMGEGVKLGSVFERLG